MAKTNRQRVDEGLDLLRAGLAPFVERELEARLGAGWLEIVEKTFDKYGIPTDDAGNLAWDASALLKVMWDNWNEVFRLTLGHAERSLVSELRNVRNDHAHQKPMSYDDTHRALDTAHRLLTAISAPQAAEIDKARQEVMRVRFAEQARAQTRRTPTVEGQPQAGLKPWREIVTPHKDVTSGRYQTAEFAADLAQVRRGEASQEYQNPEEFFRRTFLTDGLRRLLKDAALRLAGKGGNPVVELKTNFGGGKTHSMLALHHLFSGEAKGQLPGAEDLLQELDMDQAPVARRAILVGTELTPGQPHDKPDGTVIRTLWGEMAYQLGGAEGYAMVAELDANGTSPGSALLSEMFNKYAPCLILVDEWVAFVRQTYGTKGLPGGSFDSNMTFVQALSEAVKAADRALLVASLPASQIEIGGEGGEAALKRIETTFGRLESAWKPARPEEGFEIVRRRLFSDITEPEHFAARDVVVKAFGNLYRTQAQEFPSECGEVEYERRLKACYPIHPELFRRLNDDWGSLERFQRTRGVLRLMASVIYALWRNEDRNLMILPSTVPMDDGPVQAELTTYLPESWDSVISKDVDGPESLPLGIDAENPNFGRYSACRRAARTIFIGSAPTSKAQNPGIDDRAMRLGCVQPGETVATFGDAVKRLSGRATFLYEDGRRYWYDTQPNVTRLAQDRAAQQDEHEVEAEIVRRLRLDKQRGDFCAVHIAPESTADVPDDMEMRLVVLRPDALHVRKEANSAARKTAHRFLTERGSSPRLYRNMLAFLAPDARRMEGVKQGVREFLAWDSIWNDYEANRLDLTKSSATQAKNKRADAERAVDLRIQETWSWCLAPSQPNPTGEIVWEEQALQGKEPLAERASKSLVHDEHLLTMLGAQRLQVELDKLLWKDKDHINTKHLWECLASYPYLPRLKNVKVLEAGIRNAFTGGLFCEFFGYAAAYDEASGRYKGLRTTELPSVAIDADSVLVKVDAVNRQLEADRQKAEQVKVAGASSAPAAVGAYSVSGGEAEGGGFAGEPSAVAIKPPAPLPSRFFGSVTLDPTRVGMKAGEIAENVIQHLSTLPGAKVTVTLEIQAEVPDGVPPDTQRTVTENSNTLKFTNHGFETSDFA